MKSTCFRIDPGFFAACVWSLAFGSCAFADEAATIRVACLGDSITAGARVDAKTQSYPARLQEILGDRYEVKNFGIGGATLIKTGRPNIWQKLDEVRKFQPHVAVISLGTNDTVGGKRKNWEQIERFEDDYTELIASLAKLPTKPQIVICTPTAMVLKTPGLSADRLANLKERQPRLQELRTRIRKLAKRHADQNVRLLELNEVLKDRPELLTQGDGVHPNAEGYLAVAKTVANQIRPQTKPPNIVLFLADDLGYGDLSCNNPDSRIRTPVLDGLAAEGMNFSDAHTPSGVCSPTRYGLLTGRYAWRTRLKRGVLRASSPPLIEKSRLTLPKMLVKRGYATGAFGKWHLGRRWTLRDPNGAVTVKNIDWSKPAEYCALDAGFTYYYGLAKPAWAFMENRRVLHKPTEPFDLTHVPAKIVGPNNNKGFREPGFTFEKMLPAWRERIKWFYPTKREGRKAVLRVFCANLPAPANFPEQAIPREKQLWCAWGFCDRAGLGSGRDP